MNEAKKESPTTAATLAMCGLFGGHDCVLHKGEMCSVREGWLLFRGVPDGGLEISQNFSAMVLLIPWTLSTIDFCW